MTSIQRISLVFLMGFFCCKGVDKGKPIPILPDHSLDKVRLFDLENKPIELKQYEGKTIFLNFWAAWCKPCTEEMPSIEKAQNLLRNEKIVFLLASGEGVEEIIAFRTDHNYQFNYARIGNSEELDIQALPTTFIFDASGTLVFSEMGSRQWDEDKNIDLIRQIINKND